jgi:hypothetical protein
MVKTINNKHVDSLQLDAQTIEPGADIGKLYFDDNDKELKVCKDGISYENVGGGGAWEEIYSFELASPTAAALQHVINTGITKPTINWLKYDYMFLLEEFVESSGGGDISGFSLFTSSLDLFYMASTGSAGGTSKDLFINKPLYFEKNGEVIMCRFSDKRIISTIKLNEVNNNITVSFGSSRIISKLKFKLYQKEIKLI